MIGLKYGTGSGPIRLMKILVLNSGSSSQKSRLYEIGNSLPEHPPRPLWDAKIEWEGRSAEVEVGNSEGATFHDRVKIESRHQALELLLHALWDGKAAAIAKRAEIGVVGHRIVHGGGRFDQPAVVTAAVKRAIASVSEFAPLHNRAELEGIGIIEKLLGTVPQVAVFDTAFHHNLPLAAAVYPGPYAWFERGIRRYGFHGINHQYCAERASQLLRKEPASLRLVSCHLGNGCSLAAIDGGKSIDTTMGFTPLEGLMMGTRSGTVDPAILTYLMRQDGATADQIDDGLNEKSGLLGISGVSSDMRPILEAMKRGDKRAQLAFDIFVHRLCEGIGAMAAALGGMDALIFTAGIGENSADVRAAACSKFGFLGLGIDESKNSASPADIDIASSDSRVRILVIRAEEDWSIARSCWKLARSASKAQSQ
jgi:acetate kinase